MLMVVLLLSFPALAENVQVREPRVLLPSENELLPPAIDSRGYLARIQLDSPEEVEAALRRAEQIYLAGELPVTAEPLAFVLHGPEVAIFFRENYQRFKPIIDLAARLSAFEVIEMKVCETRMGVLGRDRQALFPFVGTVPFGPSEVDRLMSQEGYVYF